MRKISKNDLLADAIKIPYLDSRVVKNGDGVSWTIPVDELRLGNDWYLEKYQMIYEAPERSVIIDAGCKTGDWIGLINHIPMNVIKIGIDPIDYHDHGNWTYYHECALDDVKEEKMVEFCLFDEPGCNSLLEKSEHLNRNFLNKISVPVKSLEMILISHGMNENSIIHYVKCDCQGKDIDAVKSLGKFLKNTKYVQIECSLDKDQPFYVGQRGYEEEILMMKELGFDPIYYIEYTGSPLPEGEILFKNANYVNNSKFLSLGSRLVVSNLASG